MRAGRAKLLLAMAVLVAWAVPVKSSTNDAQSDELPIEVYDGYLVVVQGSIGELHGLKFLMDTGVSRSVIDRRVADAMALPRWTATLVNFDKTMRVESCLVPELGFGSERALNMKVTVADLTYLSASGVRVDAVIGWDLLRRKSFRLDFARKVIVFEPKDHRGTQFAPIRPNDWFLMVEANLDGRPVWMVADTGVPGAIFYQERLRAMPASYEERGSLEGRSLNGTVTARVAIVAPFRLGAHNLDRTVQLVREPSSGAPEGVAGYLGLASLNAKEIDFDFEKNQLRWTN